MALQLVVASLFFGGAVIVAVDQQCNEGEAVMCGDARTRCLGNQCCPPYAGSQWKSYPCPSASDGYDSCEIKTKVQDCVKKVASGKYDQKLAIEYAKLAGAAYCTKDTLQKWDCGPKCIPGVSNVAVCSTIDSTQVFIARWKNKCLLSFEGTIGVSSMISDVYAFREDFGCTGCSVHRGFLDVWTAVKSCIIEALKGRGCHQSGIRATGHSMGAGVVGIAAYDLQQSGWNVDEVYTFGMPRIGDVNYVAAFNEMFKGKFFRVTHGMDPFLDMPLRPWYRHVEPEVFYKGDVSDGYVICQVDDDVNCSAQYFPDFYGVGMASRVAYHHTYLGVDTTQGDCKANATCQGEIEDSWCAWMIPCNADVRGKHVHCNGGMAFGYGKCVCNPGYCQVMGRCVAANMTGAAAVESLDASSWKAQAKTGVSTDFVATLCFAFISLGFFGARRCCTQLAAETSGLATHLIEGREMLS